MEIHNVGSEAVEWNDFDRRDELEERLENRIRGHEKIRGFGEGLRPLTERKIQPMMARPDQASVKAEAELDGDGVSGKLSFELTWNNDKPSDDRGSASANRADTQDRDKSKESR